MKTLVIGLDCAAPEILFQHPGLDNIRSLMERGCYGRLESVIPPITVPAWMCMSTSQDPGSLGVYGFRNRKDYSYHGLSVVNSSSIQQTAIWDVLGGQGQNVVVVGVPPSYPPRRMQGVNVGCFMTPDTKNHDYTYPTSVRQEIDRLVGEYPVDVKGFRTNNKDWLKEQIFDMTKKHFEVLRYLMATLEWDYFQFVEIGVDRIHHGFWKYHDKQHRQHVPGNPYETLIYDYYAYVDQEIGTLLELLDDDTNILVVSDHGAQRLEGGFCVNEWLRREGLLVLNEPVTKPTPFSPSLVDWSRTRVWSEGGYYARVFFNVEGREPQGIVPESGYDELIQDMTARFEALVDDRGEPMGSLVFRPRDLYRGLRNVPPDLIVHFGALYWRSIGGLGYDTLYLQENDTGPDDCNHAQFGSFLLAAPGLPVKGEVEGMRLLDIAPTLLDLSGVEAPESMQGSSLLERSREADCEGVR
ncbi:MAG TPA: alkaline phosphatase family protein [Bryobacteraceae bacterium]|nr:alkaline phosphatase family protein [Bryobacteraceae bacterium]